ncbi:nitrate reductase cytochrome c-type subunit [Devosia sp. XJ19-1]|uniref:Periplasmic nitrate reductase, electron transfer subunit n=1 Tax=Devosia ureilytica TaxID=2952754 RepID=A0A9Q4FUD7_9HYPH|nr:nitrate reductase cytochrome c-type subunit [Devosia ureilytica]MCP8885053.1 nitrate reductase cytochrome c-type subunit [Devosia ureilytica]MCP8889027.1 nitrate reductase cytochrome c-type subunit [Devosia ureilytica]
MRGKDHSRRLTVLMSVILAVGILAGSALAQFAPELRGPTDPMSDVEADPIPRWVTDDVRQMRAYPEQPPVIPHSIQGYQLSVNTNRCMSCHNREFTQGSGAPMISITHFMTREGQMLADVSPRRYFCTACHVPQADVAPLVENDFVDMIDLGAKPVGSE